MRWAPPPGTPPHDVPRPYLLAMRSRDWAWWRPLLGLLLFAVVYTAAVTVLVIAAVVTGASPDLAQADLVDPVTLLVTNLTLIVAIPVVWLTWVVAHGMGRGWSSSVLARLRRRLFLPFTLRALATLGVGIGLSVVVGLAFGGDAFTGPVPGFGWLLVVVILTTPLQSAAEEYVFRGYLSQTIAGWIGRPRAGAVVAAVVTAALFSAAHLPPDFLTFLDRFVFGLAASAVVWLTGGLEGAIVLHAVNNVLIFVLAGALGEAVVTEDVPAGPGILYVLITVVSMAAYVALVGRSRRRLGPEVLTPALDLRGPPAHCRSPHSDSPLPRGSARPGRRQVSSIPGADTGRRVTLGVWGNWQPDGFWLR
jgi:membrane protease YdiL (CAAX protease family)